MAKNENKAQKPARVTREWYPEVCENGAIIAAVVSVLLMMILYIRGVMASAMWTWSLIVAVALLALAWFKGGRSVVARVLVRVVAWPVAVIAFFYALVMFILIAQQFWGVLSAEFWMMWVAPQTGLSAALLAFLLLPLNGLARTAHKKSDIWLLRVSGTLCALLLVVTCVFGGGVQWGFDNLYFKIFTCLIAGLAGAFPWLIHPQSN